ncbi:probable glutamine--tRNA ligase [Oppia nitens]|uniref:probable glutamine--tRNA ligase n=1 Tax=Oppia nitens TaxID=1686743 RepID=UPI0023DB7316|nr:probable glutamine--tRNA ligase [Oppia nitens]
MNEELIKKFASIGLSEAKAKETLKNESLSKTLDELIDETNKYLKTDNGFSKSIGKLVYQTATTIKLQIKSHLPLLIEYIAKEKIDSEIKLIAAIDYLLTNPSNNISIKDFETNCGVGVTVSEQEIKDTVKSLIESNKNELIEKRYRFNVGILLGSLKKTLKFADGKVIKDEVDKQILELLGPKTESDSAKPTKEKKEKQTKSVTELNGQTSEITETNFIDLIRRKEHFHKVGENYKTDGYVITDKTNDLIAKHLKATGGKVMTRFPPEPNGILHIGHAKAININFGYAEAHNGHCYLRYDDTNPEKEEERFVREIKEVVEWLGFKAYKITFSSDYFNQLYEYAIKLIQKDMAYVCHQKQEELKGFNPPPSPWRNRSITESLKLFEDMRKGKFAEGEATLRMKITLEEGKQDPVAYRIRYTEHHRTGNKWCIYPTYDYTHCLCDSIENITHSLCTKEFQSRRSSYYWLCNSVDVYCPVQWEYGRLNINYTVVSKRKIAKLIEEKIVSDWDDPRLFTLTALRRRGFPSDSINAFIAQMGLTGALVVVDPIMLESFVRDNLNLTAPRCMAVLDPIKVKIINFPSEYRLVPKYLEVPDFPSDPNNKSTHLIPFERTIYIESSDFMEKTEDKNYRRLTPNQMVGLKHTGYVIEVTNIVKTADDKIDYLEVKCHKATDVDKPKSFIHWVCTPLMCEIRLYDRLFNHKNPEDPNEVPNGFLSDCNRNSLTVIKEGLVDVSVKYAKVYDKFQFERIGFFSVDPDSTKGRLVFNRTVSLKDSSTKN